MNIPLIEKWRPKEFKEVVGLKDIERFSVMISDPLEMPNLLFYGPQGTGKTSLAKIIINKLQPINVLRINGSDTTGVDTIRDKVYNFMTSKSSESNKPRLVWIEEFDFMSQNAFAALRSMIEQYIQNARFICTGNYLYKIPEPIQSRFSVIEFEKPNDDEILPRIKFICEQEEITVEDDVLKEIIKGHRGDIRGIINTIQQLSLNNDKHITTLDLSRTSILADDIYELILKKQWSKLRYEIPQKNPDYNNLLVELDEKFFESDLPIDKKADINEVISSGIVELTMSFNEDIAFSAICSRIIKVL